MLNDIARPYRWHGFDASAVTVVANKTPAGTYHGRCRYEPMFVRARMLDRLAGTLSLDPAELCARNLIAPEHLPHTTGPADYVTGGPIVLKDGGYPRVWRELLLRSGYGQLREEVRVRRRGGERVGIGLSAIIEVEAPGAFEQARAVAEPDGSFTVHVGIGSVGQDAETAFAQVVADGLGLENDRVAISYKDTDVVPEGRGAFSSRTTMFGGNAVAGAVATLRAGALRAVAERLDVSEDALDFRAGAVVRSGSSDWLIPAGDLGAAGEYPYEAGAGPHVAMGANLAVVRVEPPASNPVVLRYAAAYDVGRVVNPLTLEGQIKGGVVQGIGGEPLEEFRYDDQGQPLSTTFMDYTIPTAVEASAIEAFLLELGAPSPRSPLGAKGGAEGGIVGVGGTIANAAVDAPGESGASITSLPLRPGPLWEQIGDDAGNANAGTAAAT